MLDWHLSNMTLSCYQLNMFSENVSARKKEEGQSLNNGQKKMLMVCYDVKFMKQMDISLS